MNPLSHFTVLIERRARRMNLLSNFTVLIERRALKECFKRLVAATAALAMLGGQPAFAAPGNGNGQAKKIAKDLQAALDAPTTPNAKWAKDVNGTRHVQVVIMARDNSDREMTNLRERHQGQRRLGARGHARPARGDRHAAGGAGGQDRRPLRRLHRGAQPRHLAHRQHAGVRHRHADHRGAQQQHQDQLLGPGRHGHRHRGARLGRDEDARGLQQCVGRDPRQAQRADARHHAGQLGAGRQRLDLAAARLGRAGQLRGRDRQRHGT